MFGCEQVLNLQHARHVVCTVWLQVASGPQPDNPPTLSPLCTGDLAACEVCSEKTSESNDWLHRLIKGKEIDRNGERG